MGYRAGWASCGHNFLSEEGVMTTVHGIILDYEALDGFCLVRTFQRLVKIVRKWSAQRGAHCMIFNNATGFNMQTTDPIMRSLGGRVMGAGKYIIAEM